MTLPALNLRLEEIAPGIRIENYYIPLTKISDELANGSIDLAIDAPLVKDSQLYHLHLQVAPLIAMQKNCALTSLEHMLKHRDARLLKLPFESDPIDSTCTGIAAAMKIRLISGCDPFSTLCCKTRICFHGFYFQQTVWFLH
jgi:hypothetical protein